MPRGTLPQEIAGLIKGLLTILLTIGSLNKALLGPYFLWMGGFGGGGTLGFPWFHDVYHTGSIGTIVYLPKQNVPWKDQPTYRN